jgi:hypothetical protein
MLVSRLPYSLTLKTEATCYSETSVHFKHTTRHYILGDRTPHNLCCEDLKSYMHVTLFLKFYSRSLNKYLMITHSLTHSLMELSTS